MPSSKARGKVEDIASTIGVPLNLTEEDARIYLFKDERHQTGRIGYRRLKTKVPVVIVGHSFAIQVGAWASEAEYGVLILTKPYKLRRSPTE